MYQIVLLFLILINVSIDAATTPKPIPYVKAIYSAPLTYDPSLMNDTASLQVSELIYEGLVRFNDTYQVIPALAKNWETSRDGKTLTFILRDKIFFHDGSEINSSDVVYSLTRNLTSASLVSKFYDVIEGANEYLNGKNKSVMGLKILSKKKIEIVLTRPYSQFLYILAGSTAKILPEKLTSNESFFKKPIGSGPFKIESLEQKKIELSKNAHYYEPIFLDKITLKVYDEVDAKNAAKAGKVYDLSSYPLQHDDKIFEINPAINSNVSETWIIGLNSKSPAFQDIEQRRLFIDSIDREKFRRTFYPKSTAATNIIPKGYPGNISSELKKSRLASPHYKKISLVIPKELEQAHLMAKELRIDLERRGWQPVIEILPWDELMKRYVAKTMDAFLISMNIDYPDAMFLFNNFHSKNQDSFSQINNKKLDKMIEQGKITQSRIDKAKIYDKIAKTIEEQAVSVNLFYPKAHQWISKCVKGYKPSLIGLVYTNYRNVSIDQTCAEGRI